MAMTQISVELLCSYLASWSYHLIIFAQFSFSVHTVTYRTHIDWIFGYCFQACAIQILAMTKKNKIEKSLSNKIFKQGMQPIDFLYAIEQKRIL